MLRLAMEARDEADAGGPSVARLKKVGVCRRQRLLGMSTAVVSGSPPLRLWCVLPTNAYRWTATVLPAVKTGACVPC